MSSNPLKNPKQEHFCRLVVSGKPVSVAYELAGYSPDRSNCWKLRHREEIDERIAYLNEMAAQAVCLNRGDIIRMLLEERELAREHRHVSAAVKATELIGKEMGMFRDKKEVSLDVSNSYADLLRDISGQTKPLVAEAEDDIPLDPLSAIH